MGKIYGETFSQKIQDKFNEIEHQDNVILHYKERVTIKAPKDRLDLSTKETLRLFDGIGKIENTLSGNLGALPKGFSAPHPTNKWDKNHIIYFSENGTAKKEQQISISSKGSEEIISEGNFSIKVKVC